MTLRLGVLVVAVWSTAAFGQTVSLDLCGQQVALGMELATLVRSLRSGCTARSLTGDDLIQVSSTARIDPAVDIPERVYGTVTVDSSGRINFIRRNPSAESTYEMVTSFAAIYLRTTSWPLTLPCAPRARRYFIEVTSSEYSEFTVECTLTAPPGPYRDLWSLRLIASSNTKVQLRSGFIEEVLERIPLSRW